MESLPPFSDGLFHFRTLCPIEKSGWNLLCCNLNSFVLVLASWEQIGSIFQLKGSQVFIESYLASEPTLSQMKYAQLFQPVLTEHGLQAPPDFLIRSSEATPSVWGGGGCTRLNPFQLVNIPLKLQHTLLQAGSDESRTRTSHDPDTVLRLRQPRIAFAYFAAALRCWLVMSLFLLEYPDLFHMSSIAPPPLPVTTLEV